MSKPVTFGILLLAQLAAALEAERADLALEHEGIIHGLVMNQSLG